MKLYEYAVLRAVPRIERGELINVGVVLHSHDLDFLGALVCLDEARLRALDPSVDLAAVHASLEALRRTALGEGPADQMSRTQRFGWLTAPRSTVLQAGPVHIGLTDDAPAELARLLDRLVR